MVPSWIRGLLSLLTAFVVRALAAFFVLTLAIWSVVDGASYLEGIGMLVVAVAIGVLIDVIAVIGKKSGPPDGPRRPRSP